MSNPNPKDAVGLTKPRVSLVPPALALHVSQAMADGARKYGPFNWREHPVLLSVYLDGILRHVYAAADGEDFTRDNPKVRHIAAIAAGCGIILDALETGNLIDDRPKAGPAADIIERLTFSPDEPIPFKIATPAEPDPFGPLPVPTWENDLDEDDGAAR